MAIDATFQLTVDKLPLIFAGIISPTEGFLPILAGILDHLDTETFKLIFSYPKDNGFPAPIPIQADSCRHQALPTFFGFVPIDAAIFQV